MVHRSSTDTFVARSPSRGSEYFQSEEKNPLRVFSEIDSALNQINSVNRYVMMGDERVFDVVVTYLERKEKTNEFLKASLRSLPIKIDFNEISLATPIDDPDGGPKWYHVSTGEPVQDLEDLFG